MPKDLLMDIDKSKSYLVTSPMFLKEYGYTLHTRGVEIRNISGTAGTLEYPHNCSDTSLEIFSFDQVFEVDHHTADQLILSWALKQPMPFDQIEKRLVKNGREI